MSCKAQPTEVDEIDDADSYVYFIVAGDIDAWDAEVKIGYSSDPFWRSRNIRHRLRKRLTVVAKIPGGYEDEQAMHRRFKAHRLRGEWFVLASEIREFIACLDDDAR